MAFSETERALRRTIARLASLDEVTTREVLAALDTAEQARVLALLSAYAVGDAHLGDAPAPSIEVEYPKLSGWLQTRLAASIEGPTDKMTPKAREGLRQAAAPDARPVSLPETRRDGSWRSRRLDLS